MPTPHNAVATATAEEKAAALTLRFWGTRGSIPSPGPATAGYGGNTPCVQVETRGSRFILDAGSGIRPLGIHLLEEQGPLDTTIFLPLGVHLLIDGHEGGVFVTPLVPGKNPDEVRKLPVRADQIGLTAIVLDPKDPVGDQILRNAFMRRPDAQVAKPREVIPKFLRDIGNAADVLTVIANWPKPRIEHWVTLLRARAIENQAYVAGVNRCGADPTLEYTGRSIIIDPHGTILADAGSEQLVINAAIDLPGLREYRRWFHILQDARPKFLGG